MRISRHPLATTQTFVRPNLIIGRNRPKDFLSRFGLRISTYSKRSAFTLVELLTVVAIIGILIGLTITVAGPARKAAHKAVSFSNERQIVQGLILYNVDHRKLPQLYTGSSTTVWARPFWNHSILSYMGMNMDPQNLSDPFYAKGGLMPHVFLDPGAVLNNTLRGDYGVVYHLTNGPFSGANRSLSLQALVNPATTPLLATAQQISTDGVTPIGAFFINNTPTPVVSTSTPEVADRYDGNCIIGFADGHVAAMPRAYFYSTYLPWTNH